MPPMHISITETTNGGKTMREYKEPLFDVINCKTSDVITTSGDIGGGGGAGGGGSTGGSLDTASSLWAVPYI